MTFHLFVPRMPSSLWWKKSWCGDSCSYGLSSFGRKSARGSLSGYSSSPELRDDRWQPDVVTAISRVKTMKSTVCRPLRRRNYQGQRKPIRVKTWVKTDVDRSNSMMHLWNRTCRTRSPAVTLAWLPAWASQTLSYRPGGAGDSGFFRSILRRRWILTFDLFRCLFRF